MILIVVIMNDPILVELGLKIRAIRLQKKLTQAELANKCECNRNYISMLERGERNPSYKSLVMIAKGLEVSLCTILNNQQYDSARII